MRKNRIRQISLIVVSMMLLSLLGSGTSIAGEPDGGPDPIAAVTIEPGVITWEAQAENGGMVLAIAGPGDFYSQQEYPSGAQPTFKPVDGWGKALSDGVYNYELLLLPAKWEAPTEYDEAQRGLEPPEGAAEARVLSGSFSILSGSFVTPQAEEGGAEGKIELGEELTDQVITDDLIVQMSACIGYDCYNGENFGFDTLRLKENNLRIKFQDTSTSGSYPSNDWQITANESSNGGANKFSIDDIDSGRTPFTIEAGTRANALYVDDSGRVGLGTSTPSEDLQIWYGDTPTVRLEQSGGGWAAQTWDVAGNEANFFIRDVTHSSNLPFRIRAGASHNSLYIDTDGDVGLGTQSPAGPLHVVATAPDPDVDFVVDANGKVGIGTTGPGAKLEVVDPNWPVIDTVRTSTATGSLYGIAAFVHQTSGNMQNGFGAGIAFLGTDSGASDKVFGVIGGIRGGADTEGALVFRAGTNGNEDFMRIDNDGNVGIGTTSPGYKLDVAGSAHASSFPTSSDARLKTNVTQLTDVLEKLEKVRGVSFDWNELYESLGRSTGHREIGVIAQEVEAVFPELVTAWDDEDYMAVDYGRLTGVLIEAVKELRAEKDAEIAALKQQNADLEGRVATLEALVASLVQGETE